MKLDTDSEGLESLFKPYQAEILKRIWQMNRSRSFKGCNSATMHAYLKEVGRGMSRASVIHALDYMVEQGILNFEEETCKGGSRRIYLPRMRPYEFQTYIINTVQTHLHDMFDGEWWI